MTRPLLIILLLFIIVMLISINSNATSKKRERIDLIVDNIFRYCTFKNEPQISQAYCNVSRDQNRVLLQVLHFSNISLTNVHEVCTAITSTRPKYINLNTYLICLEFLRGDIHDRDDIDDD